MMKEDLNSILQKAAIKVLRPLVRVMLRNGVACGSFESLVRKAYVDEAFKLSREQGNKTTISAVSAQTGLSRKEVKRLSELETSEASGNSQKYNRAIRVISGWMNDPRYQTVHGLPGLLPLEGDDASFASLVKEFSGDIPTRAMLDLLQASGCVDVIEDKVNLVSHAYVPGNDPSDIINILGADANELMNSIIFNMSCDSSQRRFQRKVSNRNLATSHVEAFQKYSSRRSQALLEDLDHWLSEHEAESGEDSEYVSLGIYFYQDESNGESSE